MSTRHAATAQRASDDAPRRGRPPRLSRGAILDAAVELLEREPHEPLTVARIAKETDAVPAALYRHFASLDDLLDGVLARALSGVDRSAVRSRAGWAGQIRDWMTALRRGMLRYPAVVQLIGRRGRTSPAWLEAVAAPIAILERAGLRGAKLARTHLWLTEVTAALILQEAAMSVPEQLHGAHAALPDTSAETRARFAPLLAHLDGTGADDVFAFAADRTIDALAALIERR